MEEEQHLGAVTKLQPLFIIAAAVLGIILGQASSVSDVAGGLIEPFLMVLIFMIFLKVDIRDIGRSFKNVRFTGVSLLINFVLTPILAVVLGILFLGDSMDMRIGLLMLLVTPCTDWYLVFTGMAKGNVPLSTAILPTNLVIQIILLPVYLMLFQGTGVSFDVGPMLMSILIVLLIPFIAAMAVKFIIGRIGRKNDLDNVIERSGDNLQMVFLCMAVVAMFASQGKLIVDEPMVLVQMLIPLCIFFIAIFLISQAVGKIMGFSFDDTTSLTFTTMARNSPLALAIAIAAFPDSPLIALVLVVGPLIELPVLSLASSIVLRMRKRSCFKENEPYIE